MWEVRAVRFWIVGTGTWITCAASLFIMGGNTDRLLSHVALMLGPPMAVLALGVGLVWAWRGY
jgi:hypothetical protein